MFSDDSFHLFFCDASFLTRHSHHSGTLFEHVVNKILLLYYTDKLAALWPFLGICAEVVILCTIIFIYERRRAKKMEEEEMPEEAGQLWVSIVNLSNKKIYTRSRLWRVDKV